MSATPRGESGQDESGQDESGQTESDGAGPEAEHYIDEQEEDSFPASDPHSDWSGPPERD